MINNNLTMSRLINDIKVHGAILVMGAGASLESGLPLYAQFAPIIWQVVDEFSELKAAIKCSENIPAKNIIGNDSDKIKQAFNYIETHALANIRFKELFRSLNDKHKNNNLIVHKNICKLIHTGYIKMVVSFNWDDLLETAWESLYSTYINENRTNLIKPHGDVRNLSAKWIYPNCAGFLSAENIATIESTTKEGPSTFVILGYSEQDKVIADTFINPNENRYVLYRISPSANGDNAITLKASEATQSIVESLEEFDENLWIHLDFSNQVGLEHAIMGHRLLPCDVSACPRLPQLDEATIRLEQVHSIIIEGAPGSGKSITAYQMAWDYQQKGWETLRLNISKLNTCKNDITLSNNGYKTVFIIDDAQQLDKEIIISLLTKANQNSKLIITQTITSNFPTESITISQEQAVEALYMYYKKHKHEALPIIKATNKPIGRSIGDNPMETPFDFVLDLARKESTPWMFNYSVRGGWESTSNQYAKAKEHNRADLLLSIIALKQILTLDKPVDKDWLCLQLQLWGYDESWLLQQLDYLYQEKLIIDLKELRSLHLQMAIRIIVNHLKQIKQLNDEDSKFYLLLQRELLDNNNPLLGIHWFFDLLFAFDVKYKLRFNVFTDEFNEKLLYRCSQQTEPKYKSHAGFVIDRVLCIEAELKYKEIISDNNFLQYWIENVDNETAYSYSRILNSMINESSDEYKKFIHSLNNQPIIESLKCIKSDSLYSWAIFLNRLLYNHKTEWSKIFGKIIPKKEISETMQKCPTKNIGGLSEMLCTLRYIDEPYCFEEYHKCLWIIEKSMQENFICTLEELSLDFSMYILGEDLFSLGRPTQVESLARKAFVGCITSDMIKKCIFEGTPRDWDTFYRFSAEVFRYDSQKIKDALKDEDFSQLNSKTADMWNEQPDVLVELLFILYPCNKSKAEEWIYSNRSKIKDIDTGLTEFSPRTAEYVYNQGGSVILTKSHRWSINANAISALRLYKKDFCSLIVNEHLADIKQSIYDLSHISLDEYHYFIEQLLKVNKNLIDAIICDIDIELIENKWADIFENKWYAHHKKDLQGFRKLITLIRNNTNNQLLVKSMERMDLQVVDSLKNLKRFTF